MMHKTPPTIERYKLGPVVSLVSGVDDLTGELLRDIEHLLDDFEYLEKTDLRAFQDRIQAVDLEARKAFIALHRIHAR